MKKLSRRELSRIVVASIGTSEMKQRIRQSAAHLIDTGRGKQIELFIKDIETEVFRQYGHMATHIATVFGLDTTLRQHVSREIKNMTGATSVELIESIDPSLLGGTVIATPEMEVDLSLSGKLKRLKEIEV